MKLSFFHQSTMTDPRPNGAVRAFTLTELLVMIGMTALSAVVLLSAGFTTRESVLRAQCASNLRQIGVGLNLYAAEANGYFPICCWPQGQNPWQSSEACRVNVASPTNVTRGSYNLGLLFRTKAVSDARAFYCPGLARISTAFSYDYYATPPNSWPSTPVGSMDDHVRTGYNYYPQLRATEQVSSAYGVFTLPKLGYSTVQLEFGSLKTVSPAKWTELDPKKSVTTDQVYETSQLSHRASGSVAGANILFADAHVRFVSLKGNNTKGSGAPFDPYLWDPNSGYGTGPGNDPSAFRIIMNGWKP
jgi:prepilin-type processing-associated H-X9-DG protein